MPNWCNNTIEINGPTETIKTLWEQATDESSEQETGLLDAMHPMPKELHGTTAPNPDGGPDWYGWRTSNWGTKWEISTEGLEFHDNGDGTACISGWFDSAWAPPIGAYEYFSEMMDNCHIDAYYEEGGMDFAGHWSSDGGDDYLEDISEYAREVVVTGESGSELYDMLDEYLDLTESRREYIEEEMEEENLVEE